jgi:peptide-methionine (S)-S-oxide reductase
MNYKFRLTIIFILFTVIYMNGLAQNRDQITLGAGCFWCVEAVFQRLDGVIKVESGYTGGKTVNPTYEEVCTGTTGHAEVVRVTYDQTKISTSEILRVFFLTHDPTTLNRQGADKGTQYRSVIYYETAEQKATSVEIIQELTKEKIWDNPIVTKVEPIQVFYKAESYHQNYFNSNSDQSYCRFVIVPKLEKFSKIFADKLKKD